MSLQMELESVRLHPAPQDEPPPPRPLYFDCRYELPLHRVKLLETNYAHTRDERIVFYEEPHIYTIDNQPAQASVSGLAAEFETDFDPVVGIRMMKKSRKNKWPRLQYVVNARRIDHIDEFVGTLGGMLVDASTNDTVASFEPGVDASGEILYAMLTDTIIREIPCGMEHWYVFDRCMTDDEICRAWELNGEDARNRGTEAHLQMELWFNSEPVRLDEGEVRVGLDFVKRCLAPIGAKAYRTEWVIFGEEENVAGCIDLAVQLPSGDIFLVDWKRSEKLASKMYGRDAMKAPLQHLEDCSGCAYALQLGCYQYLLEKYYGKRVVGRALASIHPTAPFTTAVPYLADEVEFLMARRRAMASARRHASTLSEASGLVSAMSGQLVMEAVRDANGVLYDAKEAKLAQISATPCPATTTAARKLVDKYTDEINVPTGLTTWRKRFPKPTDDLLFYS